jgi:predicted transcriptional regulator
MRLAEIVQEHELKVICCEEGLETDVTRGYASDLMSDVIAHAESGDLWVTLQVHVNTIAIASMKDLAAVLLVQGRRPLPETEAKAVEEKIPILCTDLSAFEIIGRLHSSGVPGQ